MNQLTCKHKLSNEALNVFLQLHANHMKSCGREMKEEYSLSNIKKVVWSKSEKCFKAYYQKEWFHYDL